MRTDLSPLRSSFEILSISPPSFSNKLFSFCLSSSVHFVRLFFLSLIGASFRRRLSNQFTSASLIKSNNHNFILIDFSIRFSSTNISLMSWLFSIRWKLSASSSYKNRVVFLLQMTLKNSFVLLDLEPDGLFWVCEQIHSGQSDEFQFLLSLPIPSIAQIKNRLNSSSVNQPSIFI